MVVVELNETKMAHCKHWFQWLAFRIEAHSIESRNGACMCLVGEKVRETESKRNFCFDFGGLYMFGW
jgi:hypothetical protein